MIRSLKFFIFLALVLTFSNGVLATDIAYVLKNPGSPDTTLINLIQESGYTYTLIDDSQVSATNFSNYGIILIGDERINNVPVNTYKSMIISAYYYDDWSYTIGSSSGSQPMHAYNVGGVSITKGIEGDFKAYTTSSIPLYYLSGKKYSVTKVTTRGDSITEFNDYVVAVKDNPRRVFFGITRTDYWTPETKQLFKNSLKWIFIGYDKDGDGYTQEQDCNDNDAGKWKYLKGYLDSDEDGYGTGSLIDVCSGISLSEGYSEINGDCNDETEDAYPGAVEIPYDELDNDCNGYDLADVDSDGYCKEDYLIQNKILQCPIETGLIGTDCNEDDNSVNPGSSDVSKNCRNDAPVIQPIEKINAFEGGNAVVTIIASDPDGDGLIYSIDDPLFEQDPIKENVFSWTPEYDDEGEHTFTASVSDGDLIAEIDFIVEVSNTNRVPVCDIIPEQTWNEDESSILDLNDYCYDLDGQVLSFELNSKSENSKINLNLENGIVDFSSQEDWFGEEWIIFKVSDGIGETNTNKITLTVNPINDAPFLNRPIQEIIWNQNTNLSDKINLRDYFSDIDSNLIFSVIGNDFIDIIINNGLVSFYPENEWFGQENVTFSASDGEEDIDSNTVSLNVDYVDKPPVFGDLNCTTDILEDTEYNCELSATDPENETVSFSIVEEESDLECSIDENTLSYIGNEDYFGDASCKIRATDSMNAYSDKALDVHITNVNDAPVIEDYTPEGVARILASKDYVFSIIPEDSDSSDLTINWNLNNESVGTATNYTFNKPKGNYQIIAEVSDGEYNVSQIWGVVVGNINEFTCGEVRGFICAEKQACSQSFLGVYDSDKCCPVACIKAPPEFKAVRNISASANKTGSLIVNIIQPLKQTKFDIGDSFNVNVNIENRLFDYDIDSDVEIYLYDITKEKVIASKKDPYKLLKNSVKTVSVEFTSEADLEESNEYAIFVRVIGEDKDNHKFYNQNYNEIGFNRKEHNVLIESIEIDSENGILCGDYIDVFVKVKNTGRTNEDIVISLTNPQLKIDDKTTTIKLEKYDEDDEIEKKFSLRIPENVKTGEYAIRAGVSFSENVIYSEKKLNIECKQETTQTTPISTITLANQEPLPVIPIMENKKVILFLILDALMIILVMIVFIMAIVVYRNKMIEKRVIERKGLEIKSMKKGRK